MTTETKIKMLKDWILEGKPITQREAIEKWNYYRLSAGIFRLRNEHRIPIRTTNVANYNNDGFHAVYQLVK